MDSDPDYEWDGGGFSDYDDDYYDGNFHDSYHDHYHSGDFHVDVDIGGVDYFHHDSDSDILRIGMLPIGGDLAAEFGIHGRDDDVNGDGDLAAEIGLYGGGDDSHSEGNLAAEIGIYGGVDDDVHGVGNLAPEIGHYGVGDDSDVEGDLAAEIGLGGGSDDINGGSDRHLTAELILDGWDEEPVFMYSPRHNLRPGTAFRLQLDDNVDLPVTRNYNTSTRGITLQASQRLIESNSDPNVRRNEEEKYGDLAKKLKNGEMASSSGEGKKDSNANGSEDDGVSCSICLEPWTTDGDHIICCLPCGHAYGFSCIKSWLQQPNSRKKIQLLEAKCASLELNNADLVRKEAEWRRSEAVLVQQLKSVANQ